MGRWWQHGLTASCLLFWGPGSPGVGGLWSTLPAAFLLCPAFLPSVFPTPHTGIQAKFRATFQPTPPPDVTGVFRALNESVIQRQGS